MFEHPVPSGSPGRAPPLLAGSGSAAPVRCRLRTAAGQGTTPPARSPCSTCRSTGSTGGPLSPPGLGSTGTGCSRTKSSASACSSRSRSALSLNRGFILPVLDLLFRRTFSGLISEWIIFSFFKNARAFKSCMANLRIKSIRIPSNSFSFKSSYRLRLSS